MRAINAAILPQIYATIHFTYKLPQEFSHMTPTFTILYS